MRRFRHTNSEEALRTFAHHAGFMYTVLTFFWKTCQKELQGDPQAAAHAFESMSASKRTRVPRYGLSASISDSGSKVWSECKQADSGSKVWSECKQADSGSKVWSECKQADSGSKVWSEWRLMRCAAPGSISWAGARALMAAAALSPVVSRALRSVAHAPPWCASAVMARRHRANSWSAPAKVARH